MMAAEMVRPRPPERPLYDAELVIYRLEEAGQTLLALPGSGVLPAALKASWPDFPKAWEAYGGEAATDELATSTNRPTRPDAVKISRMDEAYGWIALLPAERVRVRKTVLMRSLVSPRTERHLWSFRRLGAFFGHNHETVRNWHAIGVDMLVSSLNGTAADPALVAIFQRAAK